MKTLALIPARVGSKGIPGKNFRSLAGQSPVERAIRVAHEAGIDRIVLSTDRPTAEVGWCPRAQWLRRPGHLAEDDTPMRAVVAHALQQIPGPPNEMVLLLQPTQPLRTMSHLQQAIAGLHPHINTVVSVVALRPGWAPERLCRIIANGEADVLDVPAEETPRQLTQRVYYRDGTVYAFWRDTFHRCGDIYGPVVAPLIIPASESCMLDEPDDWVEAERRLEAR